VARAIRASVTTEAGPLRANVVSTTATAIFGLSLFDEPPCKPESAAHKGHKASQATDDDEALSHVTTPLGFRPCTLVPGAAEVSGIQAIESTQFREEGRAEQNRQGHNHYLIFDKGMTTFYPFHFYDPRTNDGTN
jgi:hypothetical protein